ncbi:hemolysin-III related-domain-containing protein [Lophiotrema nucula]|uniref:Hemolysin-III related-domain-containing protein n=1 Tax=Lophiotrema nucula TaxID=690887 RepID=A0A6A5ZIS6_9PLEO|nr:hemolysin-III related-domain-containing protein [Lophiotrema nucula]
MNNNTPRLEDNSNNNNGDGPWPAIGTKDAIPEWLRDNDFILNGHPLPTCSYRRSLRLLFCRHMETVNIWTHAIGSMVLVFIGFTLTKSSPISTAPWLNSGDRLAINSFIFPAALCFALSAVFHTLRSHSYTVHHIWGKMDILGIFYWTMNTASTLAAGFALFDTGGGGSRMRTLRSSVFGLLALSVMVPIFNGIWNHGWAYSCQVWGARWYLAEGLVLLYGLILFAGRIPERLRPGTFDIWGHSHQLFHICTMMGAGFHLIALAEGAEHCKRTLS